MTPSRRGIFAALLAASAVKRAVADDDIAVPGKRSMLLRNDRPEDIEPIEGMPVKSTITAPEDQSKLTVGSAATVRGFAWAGEEAIEHVEVSPDGGRLWRSAQLSEPKLHFAWRLWQVDWRPAAPGYYTILSRATDSAGRVQPVVTPWNPSGYLWNAIDRIGVTVEKKS
jgi:sulfite oxidase